MRRELGFPPGCPDEWYAKQPELAHAQHRLADAWGLARNDHAKRCEIAHDALKISPLCADAWSLLAEHEATTLDRARQLYKKAYEVAKKAVNDPLYDKIFLPCMQNACMYVPSTITYWETLITRPLMRAKQGLGLTLLKMGEYSAACMVFHDIVAHINPEDPTMARMLYLEALLCERNWVEIECLFVAYPYSQEAAFLYTKALGAFAKKGDTSEARALLKTAITCNRLVAAKLIAREKPHVPPLGIQPFSAIEASCYTYLNLKHWEFYPGALKWLAKHFDAINDTLPDSDDSSSLNLPIFLNMPNRDAASSSSSSSSSASSPYAKFVDAKLVGNTYFQRGDLSKAIEKYTKAIDGLPDTHEEKSTCYHNRALCHWKQNSITEALADCNKALALAPGYVKALRVRALCQRTLGKLAPAWHDSWLARTLEPANESAQQLCLEIEGACKEKYADALPEECVACGKAPEAEAKNKKCGKCKKARYCSRTCQAEHWSVHKQLCEQLCA